MDPDSADNMFSAIKLLKVAGELLSYAGRMDQQTSIVIGRIINSASES